MNHSVKTVVAAALVAVVPSVVSAEQAMTDGAVYSYEQETVVFDSVPVAPFAAYDDVAIVEDSTSFAMPDVVSYEMPDHSTVVYEEPAEAYEITEVAMMTGAAQPEFMTLEASPTQVFITEEIDGIIYETVGYEQAPVEAGLEIIQTY